jgi:hypothetical protein
VVLPTKPFRTWFYSQRICSALLAIGCVVGTCILLCASFSAIGANYEGPLRLLEPYRAPTHDEAVGLIPIDYALSDSTANDVIFIGGSTCRCGLDPRLFESLSGLTAYNLGSFGSLGISGQLATLEAYLAHHPAPRVVVLCMTPIEILRVRSDPAGPAGDVGPGTSAGMLYERFLRVYGTPDQRRGILADGPDSLRYFINRGMAITKASWAGCLGRRTRDRLDDPLYGFESETYRTLRDKTLKSRGFFALPKMHNRDVFFEVLEEPHAVNSWANDGVRACAALAQSHSLRLMVRLAPLSTDRAPWDRECIPAWLKQLETEFSRLSVGRPEILWYEPDLCWDGIHLNEQGVERFTAQTAEEVTALLGPRQTTGSQSGLIERNAERQ